MKVLQQQTTTFVDNYMIQQNYTQKKKNESILKNAFRCGCTRVFRDFDTYTHTEREAYASINKLLAMQVT